MYEKTILPNPSRPAVSLKADPRMDTAETTAPAVNWKPAPPTPDREEVAPVNPSTTAAVGKPEQTGRPQPMPADAGISDDRRRMNTTRGQTLPANVVPVENHRNRKGSPEQPEGVKPR